MNLDLNEALQAAKLAAHHAQNEIAAYLDSGHWTVSVKPDDTPVTDVDVAAENAIKSVLLDALPEAGFFGEETGENSGFEKCNWQWLVDPIDGTKSFIRGMPFYSTQIALLVEGQLVLGVSNAPAFEEQLVGIINQGAWLNDRSVSTRSDITAIKDAFLSTGNLSTLAQNEPAWVRFGSLVAQVKRVRGYGDFCHYHQLCCGQTDLIIESDVNILDIAALSVAVHAAGGVMTDLQGDAIKMQTTSVLAAGCRELHKKALHLLND